MPSPQRALSGLHGFAAAIALAVTPACAAETGEQAVPGRVAEVSAIAAPETAAQPWTATSILAIGDSITTGYGALGAGPDCAATEETHSQDTSYAALLAKQLNASLVVDAVSGRGLVHNFGGHSAETAKERLLDGGHIRSGEYSTLNPSLVIVHLGTNDFFQNDPGTAFDAAYQALLEEIAGAYPDARILSLIGPMLSGEDRTRAAAAIQRAVNAAKSSTGRDISFMQLNYADGAADAIGCEWHPGTGTHVLMSDTIFGKLTEGTFP